MAYQNDPSTSESQYFCIPSEVKSSLDLNLSQKTCQNFRGLDEADCPHQNVAQASMNLQEENGQGPSDVAITTTPNKYVDSTLTSNSSQLSHIESRNPGSEPGGKTTLEKSIQCVKSKRGASGWKQKNQKIKQSSIAETEKVVLALGVNDDDIVKKSPKRKSQRSRHLSIELPKSKLTGTPSPNSNSHLDIVERRLLLDERKIKLAEQRFALEEKKLEASIEIGKGLIISMERMTNMISILGVPATHL